MRILNYVNLNWSIQMNIRKWWFTDNRWLHVAIFYNYLFPIFNQSLHRNKSFFVPKTKINPRQNTHIPFSSNLPYFFQLRCLIALVYQVWFISHSRKTAIHVWWNIGVAICTLNEWIHAVIGKREAVGSL